MQKKKSINVVGIGPKGETFHPEIIENADILIGGKRLLKFFDKINCKKIPITKSIDAILDEIKQTDDEKITFLATGDPLFFGIGKRLIEFFGKKNLHFYPYINSVQLLCSKAKINYEDCINFSIHGRNIDKSKLISLIKNNYKVSVLTDKKNNINNIAAILEKYFQELNIILGQMLGTDNEQIIHCNIKKLKSITPTELDTIIIINPIFNKKIQSGIDEEKFSHEKSLITKKEIRTISISNLELEKDSIVWDIGAGSGSVSIEASFVAYEGKIFSIEKNISRIAHIKKNIENFNCYNIEIVNGTAPEILSNLPKPDRIFIGGNSGGIKPILETIKDLFNLNLIVVINIVVVEKLTQILQFCKKNNLNYYIISVQTNNLKEIGKDSHYFVSNNQIYIIKIKKL